MSPMPESVPYQNGARRVRCLSLPVLWIQAFQVCRVWGWMRRLQVRRTAWWRHLTSEGQVISVMLLQKLPRGAGLAPSENAPRVQVPWPKNFIIGQGRKSHLLYDELDIMQFVQGCISITDRTDYPAVIKAMLEQLLLTLRDAQSYGFEATRFTYAGVLSQMEDGTLSWHDGLRISEERRLAPVARGPPSHEVPVPSREAGDVRAHPASAKPHSGWQNILNCQVGGIVTRVCNFFNQGAAVDP
jgi:hypothetical protein